MKRLIITVLILSTINFVSAMNPDEQLLNAAKSGNIQLAQQAIENKANIEAKDRYGLTPLHRAAAQGFVEVAKLLLDNNANIESFNYCWWTPLYCAALYGHVDIIRLLLDYPSKSFINLIKQLQQDKTSRFFYLPKDITESVLPLFLHAPDPLEKMRMLQVCTDFENTPLDVAIKYGSPEVTALLKEKEKFYRSQLSSNTNNQYSICTII